MEDTKGRELLKALQDKDYALFNKIFSGSSDYFKSLSSNNKAIALRDLNYERHSLAVLHILNEYKSSDPVFVINKFLRQFDPAQMVGQMTRLCRVITEFSDLLVENKFGIKMTKGIAVRTNESSRLYYMLG